MNFICHSPKCAGHGHRHEMSLVLSKALSYHYYYLEIRGQSKAALQFKFCSLASAYLCLCFLNEKMAYEFQMGLLRGAVTWVRWPLLSAQCETGSFSTNQQAELGKGDLQQWPLANRILRHAPVSLLPCVSLRVGPGQWCRCWEQRRPCPGEPSGTGTLH